MIKKSMLFASAALGAMTATERRVGRYLRSPDGHPDAAPTPAADPAPAEEQGPITVEQMEAEFADPNDAANPMGDVEPKHPTTEPEADEAGEHGPEGEPAPEDKGNSAEERINEQTQARREAERQAAEARREADDLRQRIEALEGKVKPTSENVPAEDNEPNPADYEFGEADPQFTRDLARYEARQEYQAAERRATVTRELANLEQKWVTNTTSDEIKERYPDFDVKVNKGAESNAWACPPLIALGIKDSDVGADVAYHLADNAEESRRIAKLTPIEQAREFGRLEGKFLRERDDRAAAAAEAAKTPAPKVSAAPEPPQSRSRGAGGKFTVDADTDDFASFEKMADGVLGAGHRR